MHCTSPVVQYSNARYVCILYAKQKQPGAVKKGAAKQSRIKNIMWHLRWLVRTRADIKLQPIGLLRLYKN